MSIQKLYSDDPLISYKRSTVAPERTKAEIDSILAFYGVQDVRWHITGQISPWNPTTNDVFVEFIIEEMVNDTPVKAPVHVNCPIIWNKETRRKAESVNWIISMRGLHWFIKTHLEMSYMMRSSRIVAFLAYVGNDKNQIKDIIMPQLAKSSLLALPQKQTGESQ